MDAAELERMGLLPRGIGDIFRAMEWAEDEIAKAKQREPTHADAIDGAFRYLAPGGLQAFAPQLYRHHCREIIGRVLLDLDLRPATNAEICAALCASSQVAPLDTDAAYLYRQLFVRIFGKDPAEGVTLNESYPGAANELCERMRTKGAVKTRDCKGG